MPRQSFGYHLITVIDLVIDLHIFGHYKRHIFLQLIVFKEEENRWVQKRQTVQSVRNSTSTTKNQTYSSSTGLDQWVYFFFNSSVL